MYTHANCSNYVCISVPIYYLTAIKHELDKIQNKLMAEFPLVYAIYKLGII